MTEIFLLLTLIITPLFFCPLLTIDGYIMPQIGLGAILVSLATIFFMIQGVFSLSFTSILVILYFIYLMASCSWSTVPHSSLRDVPLVFSCFFAFLIGEVLFNGNFTNMTFISLGVFFTSMFISLYAIGQRFRFDPLFKERITSKKSHYKNLTEELIPDFFKNTDYVDSRAIGTLGNTNFAAGYFCSALPFILYLTVEVSWLFVLAVFVIVAAVIATKSRAGLLSLITGSIFFLILISQKGMLFDIFFYLFGGLRIEVILILVVLVLSIGATIYLHLRVSNPLKFLSEDNTLNNFLDVTGGTSKDHAIASIRYRTRYWLAALDMFKKRWLQGYGLRTYRKEVYDSQTRLNVKDGGKFLGEDYQTPQPRECHNDFIENFVEGGVVGGFLFLFILGSVFYNFYMYTGEHYILLSAVSSGIVALLVNAFFFFPLKLASSGITFWVSLALVNGITRKGNIVNLELNTFIIAFIVLAIAAMLWEGAIKPNLGNFFFMRYFTSGIMDRKESSLLKSLEYCPKETVFRTHMAIGYMHSFSNIAAQHLTVAREQFDGMVPAWALYYNSGLVCTLEKRFSDAVRFFENSINYLPSFDASKDMISRVWPLAPLKRRRIDLKKMTNESIMSIKSCEQEVEKLTSLINVTQSTIVNIILTEKVQQAIPHEWPFDMLNNCFVMPNQVGDRVVKELGPTKLLILTDQIKQPEPPEPPK